jgi:hypothetical protein
MIHSIEFVKYGHLYVFRYNSLDESVIRHLLADMLKDGRLNSDDWPPICKQLCDNEVADYESSMTKKTND